MNPARYIGAIHPARILMRDGVAALLATLVGLYLCWNVDLFWHEGQLTPHEETLELDEVLLVGGTLALALLAIAIRYGMAQRREMDGRIDAERQAKALAYQDPLTNLANRRQFGEALQKAFDTPPAADATHAVLMLDLNGFKQINDVHGHGVGDQVLIAVGARLRSVVRDGDLVARIGGDEFALLGMHLRGPEDATSLAQRIIHALATPIEVSGIPHQVGAGIGIVLVPAEAQSSEEALRKADVALYKAKAERRSALRFFEDEMDQQVSSRATREAALRTAVSRQQIEARFTPTFALQSNHPTGFEIVPWCSASSLSELGTLRLMAIAEDTGLIHEIQDHLLAQACVAARDWPVSTRLCLALYPSQLKSTSLRDRVLGILLDHEIAPSRLELQISETMLVQDIHGAEVALGPLRLAGVRMVLGQFGTGYSSLYHLRKFKVDRVKIDRSFTEAMSSNRESNAIVEALVGLGKGFGFEISADGVSSTSQRLSLLSAGCDAGQGSNFGESVSARATLEFFGIANLHDAGAAHSGIRA